ncbi:hypothetical protein D3C78_1117930 [compost metagenome]
MLVERRIASEAHRTEAIARAALVDQADIGLAGLRVDQQGLLAEAALEEAIAQRLVADQPLGILVGAVIEHRARRQPLAARQAEAAEPGGLAVDADLDVAQPHRLALDDMQAQRLLALRLDDFAADLRMVVTQRLQRLSRLALGVPGEALYAGAVVRRRLADIGLDVLAQRGALGRQQHLQLGRDGSREANQQGEQQG